MALKVLCIHGYRQDGSIFRDKSGGFRKMLKNLVNFVYIDAPHVIPQGEQNPDGLNTSKAWWFDHLNPDRFKPREPSDTHKGFDESLERIDEAFKNQGPFDGIMGFSQGCEMATAVCSLIQEGKWPYSLKFAMFFSGFRSECTPHDQYYEKPLRLPSLHVMGENDKLVSIETAEKFASHFVDPVIVVHEGAHCVPSKSKFKPGFVQFVMQFLDC